MLWLRRISLALMTSIIIAGPAMAQDYPTRPIRIIVPFAPAGSTDAVVRILAQQLGENLGQSVVVENRPGGAATIGMNLVAQAAPDGYTLGAANISFGANPSLLGKVPYDPVKDFVPVSYVAQVPLVLSVHPSLPVRSVKDLIALIKSKPNALNYSSAGYGSGSHLSMALFCYLTGTKMVNVPFNGGGPQVAATLSGEPPILFATIPSSLQYFRSGQLIPLAISTAKRDASLPNVPTVAEAGVPDYEMGDWVGIVAPKGTPEAIVVTLNREIDRVLAMPGVKEKFEKIGTQVMGGTPEDLANHIHRELDKWNKVVTTMGIRVN